MITHAYNEEEVITAMIIWEEALANDGLMAWLREEQFPFFKHGAAMARWNAVQLVEMIEAMWLTAKEKHGYDNDFDWVFVPDCLRDMMRQAPRFADRDSINQAEVVAYAIKVFD